MIPVLFITYNRLEFTKQALKALFNVRGAKVYIIDNDSTDGTVDYLKKQKEAHSASFLNKNIGIAGAMNLFIKFTESDEYVAKIDNDTIVQADFLEKMLPHMKKADLVQAKHPILKATHPLGFDQWVKTMKQDGPLRFNHFIGGSGILFKRNIVNHIPVTDWKLGGWRQWQREHPEYKKAFATDVEIKLLDTNERGADYLPELKYYYQETQRL